MSTLRGASVEVDARRAAGAVVALCLVALAVSAAVLFATGANRNAQVSDLRAHGVPVAVRVSTCLGLLGGSGSNPVGYACTGTYVYAGHRYQAAIPGDRPYAPGSGARGVTVPDDPGLLSTPSVLRGEHASASVYLAPGALTVLFVAGLAGVGWRRRRRRTSRTSVAAAQAGGV